ncbi:phosphotriesterase-related protein [Clostridiales bacterium COT073_COT-073]|nr:phosphotriesterase-related protein [Clostridiales bacterium COT073_COT-073]
MSIIGIFGEIKANDLGKTYIHEHLSIDLSSQKNDEDANFDNESEIIEELVLLHAKGIKTIVEVTNRGMGRNIETIERIAQKSGMQVIASTGFYKEPFLPEYTYSLSEKELAKLLMEDLVKGMDGTPVKAHVIGEIGTSHNMVTPMEEKIFLSSALAHLETGKPISTHTTLGTMGLWQTRFLKSRGVNMEHVVIGHSDLSADMDYHLKIADYGCFIAFDTIGKISYQPDEIRIKCLKNLIAHGHIRQILMSEDLTRKSHLKVKGGIGYSYLVDSFLPELLEAGVSEQQIETILIENPRRFLDI